jgi:hypothetical protein
MSKKSIFAVAGLALGVLALQAPAREATNQTKATASAAA